MGALAWETRTPVSEAQLIERVVNGDPLAERELYDAYVDRVYRLAFRIAGDDDLARDFTQATFIRAFEKIGSFRGESSLGTWLHSIGMSVSLNGLKKVKRQKMREAPMDAALTIGSLGAEPQPDLRERMAAAIQSLSEKYRAVFLMHDLEGLRTTR
jgi:RNA polymerase sigma factor, sigma-70 family